MLEFFNIFLKSPIPEAAKVLIGPADIAFIRTLIFPKSFAIISIASSEKGIIKGENLTDSQYALFDTLYKIHFPKDEKECREAIETLSAVDFAMGLKTYHKSKISADKERKGFYKTQNNVKLDLENALAFPITPSQSSAMDAIQKDLCSSVNMSRIVSGDVGSGFKNDSNNTDGYGNLLNPESVGSCFAPEHLADRIFA